MARSKQKTFDRAREFLNPTNKDCLAAVQWAVTVYYNKEDMTASIEADMQLSKESLWHSVNRVQDLKALDNLQAQINRFKCAWLSADEWCMKEGYKVDRRWF